ncbi:MAG: hypothetical protein LBH56_05015, partial [Coriobacteriales bacterium]|nr:hypothetical protein [Coriobacteriales bacterium]
LQRKHQKVLEEAPAAALSGELRERITAAALSAARAAGYTNAGTVEFIVDGAGGAAGTAGVGGTAGAAGVGGTDANGVGADGPDGAAQNAFFFIEMNTRIQVEHPVTEMVTGINIVREQIRIASGLPLNLAQEDICVRGHAIECRINAEEVTGGAAGGSGAGVEGVAGAAGTPTFRPCPGTIDYLHLPSGFGVRVDSVIHPGYEVSPFYDSMIAKIIVHGRTRNEAILRMRRALEETLITGVATNVGMHYLLMYNPDFLSNRIDTGFLERNLEGLFGAPPTPKARP